MHVHLHYQCWWEAYIIKFGAQTGKLITGPLAKTPPTGQVQGMQPPPLNNYYQTVIHMQVHSNQLHNSVTLAEGRGWIRD